MRQASTREPVRTGLKEHVKRRFGAKRARDYLIGGQSPTRSARRFDSQTRVCDTADMSETLTIRVPAEEKARWQEAAAAARESVAEYVRGAVRQRAQAASQSPWERHLGSADVAVPAPTNANIRRAFARRRRHQG